MNSLALQIFTSKCEVTAHTFDLQGSRSGFYFKSMSTCMRQDEFKDHQEMFLTLQKHIKRIRKNLHRSFKSACTEIVNNNSTYAGGLT